MGCGQCTVDDVVDSSMTLETALVPSAADAVHDSAVNLRTTVVAGVGVAKR